MYELFAAVVSLVALSAVVSLVAFAAMVSLVAVLECCKISNASPHSSKFVESSCLMFSASVVMAVSLSNRETHRLQQKCGKPSPSWISIWPIALNRSAILAVFPVVENSAFLLVEGTALPHVLQQLLTKSVVNVLKVAIVQLVTAVHRCRSCNRGRPRNAIEWAWGLKYCYDALKFYNCHVKRSEI